MTVVSSSIAGGGGLGRRGNEEEKELARKFFFFFLKSKNWKVVDQASHNWNTCGLFLNQSNLFSPNHMSSPYFIKKTDLNCKYEYATLIMAENLSYKYE